MNALGTEPASAAVKIRLLAVMKLYELGRVSSGSAAALAGIARVEFLAQLGEYGVSPFQLSPADRAANRAAGGVGHADARPR
jgi:hypothetical protein